ncbi:LysR family transcriptional regulator [uncultured Oxalicibacterium sp.]|uniref:LysR family transcriptional regulator n=1 Tax=uncultured Oxalicibacterium sp. TaxID=1168540 RepID=UPI0025D31BE0|nr:LysR family transcriptional regulator [uncultured Oxalicibacterium sp.]
MKTFVAVVETESFTAAGMRLDLSKAVASKYVAILEDHLGTRLLNRTTRRLSLTESGSVYYERCVQILADVEEAEQAAAQLTTVPRGTLKVALPVSYGTIRIAPLLTSYMQQHPDVHLDIALADRRVDLIEEGFDLAIRIGALPESGLVARRLATERIVLCAAPAYLARHGKPMQPADLAMHACLNYSYASTGDEWTFVTGKMQEHVRIGGPMRANNGDMLRVAALAGAGVIWQPQFIVGDDIAAGRLVELLPDFAPAELGVHALYPSRKHLSAKVRTFVDHLAVSL